MQQFYFTLKKNILFKGFEEQEMEAILQCLGTRSEFFSKNAIIREPEKTVEEIGIIAKGVVFLTKTDINGNRQILSKLTEGETFGESMSFLRAENSPICVAAATDASIVFIPAKKLFEGCQISCENHKRILENLIRLLSEKNILLQMKNDILSQKTTREKLLLYFEYESKSAGSNAFRIHFSREELADFLSLNQSAMSRELGKMRDEGLISFFKSSFRLTKFCK